MLQRVLSLLRRPAAAAPAAPAPAAPDAAAQHWDAWQAGQAAAPQAYVDWGDHPTVLALLQQEAFGDPAFTLFHYLLTQHPEFAQARALSLCSGDGGFERLLVENGIFGHVTGTDIAPGRVAAANAARGALADRLEFQVADVNQAAFGEACYDVVFAKAALHHVSALEALFAGIRRCLKPGGRLVTIDFFGPTRFQWTERQLEAANAFLAEQVPEPLRRRADGSLHRVERPTVEAMIAMDPSEAVRSAEVYGQLTAHMTIEKQIDIGGALLNLVLDPSIIMNFQPGVPEHDAVIRRAFEHERALMRSGALASDFKVILAR
jgi:SAM-dependent methyltransferase